MTEKRIARRYFLTTGIAGVGVLGLAGLWLRLDWDGTFETPKEGVPPLEVLTPREFAILSAISSAVIVPATGAPTADEARVARRIDRELLFHRDEQLARDVKSSLALLEYLPLAEFRGAKFTHLDPDGRARFLAECQNAGWLLQRQAFAGLRFLILFFYYTDDRSWHSIGYDGPAVPEKFFEGGNRIANLPAHGVKS